MNFYQSVFLEKNFLENICNKVGFGGNYPLIFTLSKQSYDSNNLFKNLKIILKNLEYICHKSAELQKNLKHFRFW